MVNTQIHLLLPTHIHIPNMLIIIIMNIFSMSLYFDRLYPVDRTRVNEYGISYDEKSKGKAHKD